MDDLDKMVMANLVLTTAIAEALLSKGLLTRDDLQNAVKVLSYETPVPSFVYLDVQKMIDRLPSDSSSKGTSQ